AVGSAILANRFSLFNIVLWVLLFSIFVLFIWLVNYEFHDPDSQLYSKLGQELSQRPLSKWIAPRWTAYSGAGDYFREHPPGVLWVNASLIRFGIPERQAAATANLIYWLLTFLFVFKIGKLLKDNVTGWAMAWAVFLIPLTFLYIVRGNLEPPLTMATVFGMYCICRAHESWSYKAGFALALIAAVFFKGLQGGFVGLVGGLYWLWIQRDRQVFITILGSAVTLVLTMVLFEWLFRAQTGQQFWLINFKKQAVAAVATNAIIQKPYNLVWYLARAIYFVLPWSIILLLGLRNRSERAQIPKDKRWWWFLTCAAMLILTMSLFDRRADRYIFPAYILIAMSGGWYVSEKFPRVRKWLSGDSLMIKIIFAAALLTVAVLKVIISINYHSNIQIWRD
ncbi:MAG: ArnT family glycosyltransferase, partial [Candidatus Zixiibacteriota bacterium]